VERRSAAKTTRQQTQNDEAAGKRVNGTKIRWFPKDFSRAREFRFAPD
jgi:hypothetical protein